jgi:hypothetical protein
VKAHLPAGFIKADDAVDLVRRQGVTEFTVAHAAFRTAKAPEGLMVQRDAAFCFDRTIHVGGSARVAQGVHPCGTRSGVEFEPAFKPVG